MTDPESIWLENRVIVVGFGTIALVLIACASFTFSVSSRLVRPLGASVNIIAVAIGLVTAVLVSWQLQPAVAHDLIYFVLLPPLLFEAALQIPWLKFRAELGLTTFLATVGLIAAAAVVAAGLILGAAWAAVPALALAVLISATDPVAVISTFKQLKIRGRLALLVEAESLLNDGTAAVLLGMLVVGQQWQPGNLVVKLLATISIGVVVGCGIGFVGKVILRKVSKPWQEIGITILAAYAAFNIAEAFHGSGVLATVAAGMWLGNRTDQKDQTVATFWDDFASLANAVVFFLIGFHLARPGILPETPRIAVVILLTLVGRAVCVYGSALVFKRSREPISIKHQHVLWWGGLRGALSMALALGLPTNFPQREEIITITLGVVAFSVIVQGMTIRPFLNRLGLGHE